MMGAWAEDAFGNDTACDWAGDFAENPSIEVVKNAIDRVLSADEYLDSDEACECLVACEANYWDTHHYFSIITNIINSIKLFTPKAEAYALKLY
ncbi:DUF4259 domain-containing protein [Aliikangiella sp. IMCC44653]